jgi:hypothetical protein
MAEYFKCEHSNVDVSHGTLYAIHTELDVQQNVIDVWRCAPDVPHTAHLQIPGWQTGGQAPEGCLFVCINSDYSVKPSF